MNRLFAVAVLFSVGLVGCSTVQYVANRPNQRQPSQVQNVEVFYDAKDVPYPFVEIGRLYPRAQDDDRGSARQIRSLRSAAAENGADGLILIADKQMKSESGYYGNLGAGQTKTFAVFSGIAIIKK